jgi:hypothetical protein
MNLPVYGFREEIMKTVAENKVIVCIGETGCGKTTQLPQYLLEAGYASGGKRIGVTQPRRVAAVSVAKRVAEERGSRIGGEIAYQIRFDDCSSRDTKLCFLTDGCLVRCCLEVCGRTRAAMCWFAAVTRPTLALRTQRSVHTVSSCWMKHTKEVCTLTFCLH